MLAGCAGNGETGPTPPATTINSAPSPSNTPEDILTKYYCGSNDFKVEAGTVVVDGRCDDKDPTRAVGLYSGTEQIREEAVARAKTGAALVAKCFIEVPASEALSNAEGNSSRRWILVDVAPSDKVEILQPGATQAKIPAIWTQGTVPNSC